MYGDPEPAQLFDPEREAPPRDAYDLLFPVPVSLSLVAEGLAQAGRQRELADLRGVYLAAAHGVVGDVQHHGGHVTGGHRGHAVPGRLELAAVAEQSVPGIPTMRLHTHLYIGRDAAAVDTGERHPVALDRLRRAADEAWRSYLTRLVEHTTRELGYEWAALPGHHPSDVEIVSPPMAEHVGGEIAGVCPGTYGPREQIRADAHWRAGIAEMLPYLEG